MFDLPLPTSGLLTEGKDGSIETAIPKRVFNEALYQLVVLDNHAEKALP